MNTTDVFKSQPMSAYDSASQPKGDMNNISGVSLASIQDRIIPRQVGTGSLRGTQTVGYGSTKIDGTNNRITVGANEASLILGDQSKANDSFGLSVSDELYPRLLAGKYPDGSIKIKLSQSGYDVNTAPDDNLIWSSDFNMFKIAISSTSSVTTSGHGTFTTLIPHSLGVVPAIIVYATYPVAPSGTWLTTPFSLVGSPAPADTSLATLAIAGAYVDDVNLTLYVTTVSAGGAFNGSWNFKYYIMTETIN